MSRRERYRVWRQVEMFEREMWRSETGRYIKKERVEINVIQEDISGRKKGEIRDKYIYV